MREWNLEGIIFFNNGMTFTVDGNNQNLIKNGNKDFVRELLDKDVKLESGLNEQYYWYTFPAIEFYPVKPIISALEYPFENENRKQSISCKLFAINEGISK